MTPLLRFDRVTLARGGRLLFETLDLALGPGERLMLVGPNGSGKSSLIRLAAGLLRPVTGHVERSDLALADDRLALDSELPLRRALGFWCPDPTRLDAALEALALAPLARVPVRLLSAGQLKRATLARVAASGAPLWLLDEPTNALDARGVEALSGLIDSHVAGGGAVLAASHGDMRGGWRRLELAP